MLRKRPRHFCSASESFKSRAVAAGDPVGELDILSADQIDISTAPFRHFYSDRHFYSASESFKGLAVAAGDPVGELDRHFYSASDLRVWQSLRGIPSAHWISCSASDLRVWQSLRGIPSAHWISCSASDLRVRQSLRGILSAHWISCSVSESFKGSAVAAGDPVGADVVHHPHAQLLLRDAHRLLHLCDERIYYEYVM